MATSWRNKKNYPLGTGSLSADITNSTLTITLNTGQGANFPSASFTVTIDEEIILIDSRSTDTLTVNASGRGYDSTTASAHAAQAGVYQYQIAKDFTDIETAVNGIENGTTTLAKVVTSGSAANTHTIDDSGTNTVISALELYHTSSGTPASGLGAKLLLGAENSAGASKSAVELQGYLSTVTSTSEVGAFLLQCRYAGALQDALSVVPGSSSVTIGSGQATVALWNTTATTVNFAGAATTINIGAQAAYFSNQGWNAGVLTNMLAIVGTTNPGLLVDQSSGTGSAAKVIVNCKNDSSYGKFQFRVANTKTFEWAVQGNDSTNMKVFYSDTDTLCATVSSTGNLTLVGSLSASGATITNTGATAGFIAQRSDNTAGSRSGAMILQGVNSASAYKTYGAIYGRSDVLTAGSEDGSILFYTMRSGAETLAMTLDKNGQLSPVAGIVCSGALAVNSSNGITTNQTTFPLVNTTATTVNAFGAATAINIGAATGTCTINNATTAISGALTVAGNTTLGDASTDTITCTGRFFVRQVSDAGPMTATGGTLGEMVYNTSNSKAYVCTTSHATAATWSALN